jgi:hypothetical protein
MGSDDRREPLPDLARLPGWLWGKLPRRARVAALLALVAGVGAAFALAPGIRESKEDRAAGEARERRELAAERVRELTAEQRPRRARSASVAAAGAPVTEALRARRRMLRDAAGRIEHDAEARVRNPILRVECEPFPRSLEGRGAHEDPARRRGRYACLAITADVPGTELNAPASIGHPYRMLADFESGRYAYCKISGRAGEGSLRAQPIVTVPEECGGT